MSNENRAWHFFQNVYYRLSFEEICQSVIMNPHEKLWISSAQVSNSILNFNACNFKNRKLLILNGYQPLFRILKNIPQYCHTLSMALKGQMNKKGGTPPQLMTKTEFLMKQWKQPVFELGPMWWWNEDNIHTDLWLYNYMHAAKLTKMKSYKGWFLDLSGPEFLKWA